MRIRGLFVKPRSREPVVARSTIHLIARQGIAGDVQAQPGNPRQVLILDYPTVEKFGLQPGDLRENILLAAGMADFASGQAVQMGTGLIRLMFRCEPCRFLETLQVGLAHRMRQERGWLGMVIAGGEIALNESVTLTEPCFPALSDGLKERFAQFVQTIPVGRVVPTPDLIFALGVSPAYYRTLPGLIQRAPADVPVHRVVKRDRTLFLSQLPQQGDRLQAEGVAIVAGQVQPQFCWAAAHFHAVSLKA